MPEGDEGSLAGKGPKELLPERGNPFAFESSEPRDLTAEDLAELYRTSAEPQEHPDRPSAAPSPADSPDVAGFGIWREDHGLSAVEAPGARAGPGVPDLGRRAEGTPLTAWEAPLSPDALPPPPPGIVSRGGVTFAATADPARLRWLLGRSDLLKQEVHGGVDNAGLARRLLTALETTQNGLRSGDVSPRDAERTLDQTEFQVHQAVRLRAWNQRTGVRVFAALLAVGIGLLVGIFLLPGGESAEGSGPIARLAATLAWGGLGGVVAALASLRRNLVGEADHARLNPVWFLTTPAAGMGAGMLVYWIARGAAVFDGGVQDRTWPLIYAASWILAAIQESITSALGRLRNSPKA